MIRIPCEACGGARTSDGRKCESCGQSPARCFCLFAAQVAAYVTGGDNARWLRRPGKSEAA